MPGIGERVRRSDVKSMESSSLFPGGPFHVKQLKIAIPMAGVRTVLRQGSKGQGAHSDDHPADGGVDMARLIDMTREGPVFRPSEVRAWFGRTCREAEDAVAEYALWRVKSYNAADFKNPTGRYRRHLRIVRRGAIEVNDSNSVYGPWLEGTGSRNRTTRFKGYHHWRRMRLDVERAAPRLTNEIVRRNISRLS